MYRFDVSMYLAHLPKLFAVCMKCLLAERTNVAECATGVMKVARICYYVHVIIM